jgi:vacuolar-type H+-ATPase catalytic subunit A/Vma1
VTTCELIMKPIVRLVEEEHKDLDEIAASVCPKVEYGREKIIRIIKDFLGEEYLIQHADGLKYDVEMARLAKKRTSHKKIPATTDSDSKALTFEEVLKEILKLISSSSLETVQKAIAEIEKG